MQVSTHTVPLELMFSNKVTLPTDIKLGKAFYRLNKSKRRCMIGNLQPLSTRLVTECLMPLSFWSFLACVYVCSRVDGFMWCPRQNQKWILELEYIDIRKLLPETWNLQQIQDQVLHCCHQSKTLQRGLVTNLLLSQGLIDIPYFSLSTHTTWESWWPTSTGSFGLHRGISMGNLQNLLLASCSQD